MRSTNQVETFSNAELDEDVPELCAGNFSFSNVSQTQRINSFKKLVMQSRTRNPEGKIPDPTPRTNPRGKPETRHSKPEKTRHFQKLCKITKKYHQNQQKIKKKIRKKFIEIFFIFFFLFYLLKLTNQPTYFCGDFLKKKSQKNPYNFEFQGYFHKILKTPKPRKPQNPTVEFKILLKLSLMFSSSFDSPAVEIIKGKLFFARFVLILYFCCLDKLYWISATRPPQSYQSAYFFNVDNVSLKKLIELWLTTN